MLHLIKRFYYRLLIVALIIGGFLLTGIATPAFADSPTINGTVTAGALSVTSSGPYSFSAPIGTTAVFSMPFSVADNTGGAAGWNLTITSTQFAVGGIHYIPITASTIVAGVPGVCTLGGTPTVNCMQSPSLTNTVAGPTAIPAGAGPPTAVKFFSIAAVSASGVYTITPVINVVIPAVTFITSYSSVFTIAIVAGP